MSGRDRQTSIGKRAAWPTAAAGLLAALTLALAGCGGNGQPDRSGAPHTPAAGSAVRAPAGQPAATPAALDLNLPAKVVGAEPADDDASELHLRLLDADPDARLTAVEDLLEADALTLDELRRLLKDDAPLVREAAIEALISSPDPGHMQLLSEAVLGDPDPQVREMALFMVFQNDGDGVRELVERALLDVDVEVRETARDLMCGLDDARCGSD